MRTLFIALFSLIILPAFAADWGRYDNARFGYSVAIPPDFEGMGEADNGDGQVFKRSERAQTLRVWGGNALDGFYDEATSEIGYKQQDGWNITYQVTTPNWASFSGTVGKRVFYQRMIALCNGEQYAAFDVEYSMIDIAKMSDVVGRLIKSLKRIESLSC